MCTQFIVFNTGPTYGNPCGRDIAIPIGNPTYFIEYHRGKTVNEGNELKCHFKINYCDESWDLVYYLPSNFESALPKSIIRHWIQEYTVSID